MKDKIIEPDCLSFAAPPQLKPSGKLAVNALVNLGYTPAVAQKAVKKTLEYFDVEPELAVIIAESLKNI